MQTKLNLWKQSLIVIIMCVCVFINQPTKRIIMYRIYAWFRDHTGYSIQPRNGSRLSSLKGPGTRPTLLCSLYACIECYSNRQWWARKWDNSDVESTCQRTYECNDQLLTVIPTRPIVITQQSRNYVTETQHENCILDHPMTAGRSNVLPVNFFNPHSTV